MFDSEKRLIWITGASTGIGKALALALAKEGHQLILSARSELALQELHHEFPDLIDAFPLDVNDDQAQLEVQQWIERKFGYLDVFINAAGICEYLDVQAFDLNMIERVMNTNFMGAVKSIHSALPLLRKSPRKFHFRPYLLVISSSIAWVPIPRAEAYGASKAAITHFCESLKADLYHENIDVSVISPGFVKTPMTDANDFHMPMMINAESAAAHILKDMKHRAWDIHFPKRFTWILLMFRCLPSALRHSITRKLSRNRQTHTASVHHTSAE